MVYVIAYPTQLIAQKNVIYFNGRKGRLYKVCQNKGWQIAKEWAKYFGTGNLYIKYVSADIEYLNRISSNTA